MNWHSMAAGFVVGLASSLLRIPLRRKFSWWSVASDVVLIFGSTAVGVMSAGGAK